MDVAEFAVRLEAMSANDFAEVCRALQRQQSSAEGEICWWKATIAVERSLKRHGLSRAAGRAGCDAAGAVLKAAERESLLPDRRDEVTAIARAAADVARGLVAGIEVSAQLASLLEVWRAVLTPAAA